MTKSQPKKPRKTRLLPLELVQTTISLDHKREKLMTPQQVAEELEIAVVTLTRMRRAGLLPYVELRSGKRKLIRFRPTDVDAMIDRMYKHAKR